MGRVEPEVSQCQYQGSVMVTAIPNDGYDFERWNDGTATSTAKQRTYYAYDDRDTTLRAVFKPNNYTVTVQTDATRGTVSVDGGGTHAFNSGVTIHAVPKTGYHFAGWEGSSTDPDYTFTLKYPDDTVFTAIFEPKTYPVRTAVDHSNRTIIRFR